MKRLSIRSIINKFKSKPSYTKKDEEIVNMNPIDIHGSILYSSSDEYESICDNFEYTDIILYFNFNKKDLIKYTAFQNSLALFNFKILI